MRAAWACALVTVLATVVPVPAHAQVSSGSHVSAKPASNGREVPVDQSILASLRSGHRFDGQIVREVRFAGITEDAKVLQGFRELVSQLPGEPLDPEKISKSILALYATGRFLDLEVEAEPVQENGIALVIVAKPNYFIGPVKIEGAPKHPAENQLITASKLQLGELFTTEKVNRAKANIKAVMAENGYYDAIVTEDATYDRDTQLVSLVFHVTANEQARVGKVTIQGQPGFTTEEVQDIAHLHTGDVVSSERLGRALQRLRKAYQSQKRLEAQVSVVGREYHPETKTLDYVFDVNRGPVVDIRVEGVKLSRGEVKKQIPVFEENAIDEDLLNEGRRNLRDYLQTKGYFDVQVSVAREPEGSDRLNVIYTVNRGDSRKLVGIAISGNHYFPDELIRERMNVRPATSIFSHGLFSQSLLAADVRGIEELYRSNGFLDAKVTSQVKDGAASEKGDISVAISVDEGQQTKVASLSITGNEKMSADALRDHMQLLERQPFSESKLIEDRDALVTHYYNDGFPDVQIESGFHRSETDPHLVDVNFKIREGKQTFVDRVLFSGLNYTRPFVVQRQMKVDSGDPLSQVAIIDSQRNLYDLGLFNEVDVAVQNPDGEAKFKDVLLDVREAKRWTFNYGIGVEVQTGNQSLNADQINTAPAPGIPVPPNTTPPQGSAATANPQAGTGFSPRVSFDVTRLNFRGRDHTLLFKANLSNLSRRAVVGYEAPHWFDRDNLRLTFSGLAENSRDVRTFAAKRYEGSVQAEQVLSKVTTLLYRFQYRLVKVDPNTLVISPELVPLFSKPVRVGMPSFTYIRDKRDDPIDTRKGNYTTFDTGVAAGVFGSAANFGRFMIQNSTYVPFKRKFVLARMTRIGVQEPFGTGSSGIVPLPERFYAGGSQSHRGFALNQAGPRDLFTGFPLGGKAVLVNQIELRLPPIPTPFVGDNLSFVLFHDAGNVFTSGQDMVRSLSRWTQPRRNTCTSEATRLQCGFDYMSQAVGLGARYKTPVGPVRLDVSYNPNPPSFPYYVQCPATVPTGKNAGPCASLPASSLIFQSGTLRHFNFFFSIGQTF